MRIFAVFLISCSIYGMSYSTVFPAAENPISQGGSWFNGAADGLDWCNVRTSIGYAWGVGPCPAGFADPTAILKGAWGPDQTVQATARITKTQASSYQEIELRLRTTVRPHSISGYEVNFGVSHAYLEIVRWNGPLAGFTYLGSKCAYPSVCGRVTGFTIHNGDVAKANISGSTISVYVNGTLRARASDSAYHTGNPGIGYNYGCDGTYADFAWENFSAGDGQSGGPAFGDKRPIAARVP
jgi:hypothetical protein